MRRKQQRPSNEIHSAVIDNYSHDGRGIARIDGKTTFIQGALPGETVNFKYIRVKRDYDEGVMVSVETAAANRVEPRCPHYQLCGGCSLQHLSEEAQIHVKQSLLLDLLERIGHVQPAEVLPPLGDALWHYRNKARLSARFVEKKQSTLVGFREKNNPRYITEITQCPVLNAKVDARIMSLRALIDSLTTPASIAQIEVAAGDDDVALIFRNMETLNSEDQNKLRQFGQESGFIIFLQPGNADSVTLFYPETADSFLSYQLPDEGVRFRFHPTDFTQVNAGLNRHMVARALDMLELQPTDVVLDLFCGLGNFSLPIAKRCAQVIGIEGSDRMVERAQMNARENCIANAQFFCADLDKPDALINIDIQAVNKLLLDPPRTGALEIVRQIDKLNVTRIVYVSCNPATLARDSDILVNQHGFQLLAAGVMDMFPHTAHVESIALFEKG